MIVVPGSPAIRAVKEATKTIPIVIVTQLFLILLPRNLSIPWRAPGGNITGLTRLTNELSGKRLELLKEAVPGISRVGILTGSGDLQGNVQDYEAAARAFNVTLIPMNLTGPKPDFEGAFQARAKGRVNGLITTRDAVTASYAKQIAEQTIKHRLPSMNEDSPYVEAGGLMSYAANDADQFRRAAVYVDKILKGGQARRSTSRAADEV